MKFPPASFNHEDKQSAPRSLKRSAFLSFAALGFFTLTATFAQAASIVLEAENLPRVGLGATTRTVQDIHASGGAVVFLDATAAGQSVIFTTPELPADSYDMQVRFKSNTLRASIDVMADEQTFAGILEETGPIGYKTVTLVSNLGAVNFYQRRTHSIKFRTLATAADSSGYLITVDSITFVPRKGVRTAVNIIDSNAAAAHGSVTVTLAPFPETASVHYTLDGSTPSTTRGLLYTGPFVITNDTQLSALAFQIGQTSFDEPSPPTTRNYTFRSTPFATYQVTPSRQTVVGNESADFTVTITGYNGFNGVTTLSAAALENTAGAVFSPSTLTGPGTSILTLTSLKQNASATGFLDQPIGVLANGQSIKLLNFKAYFPFPGEAEKIPRSSNGATTTVHQDINVSGFKWVSLDAKGAGAFAEFTLQSIAAGKYSLQLAYTADNSRGMLKLAVDGITLGTTLDQYTAYPAILTKNLGTITFNAPGNHTIRLLVTSKNPASSGFMLSADRFILSPLP